MTTTTGNPWPPPHPWPPCPTTGREMRPEPGGFWVSYEPPKRRAHEPADRAAPKAA